MSGFLTTSPSRWTLRAALALKGGAVVADPFYPTADLIDLLRARARQLSAPPGSDIPGACARGFAGGLWHGID